MDKAQYDLLGRDVHEPLVIIGGAGSGKTTVALHRIASLVEKKKVFPNQILVVVPNEGLIRLSKKLLREIGLRQVKIRTSKDWLRDQAMNLLPDLPRRVCAGTPLGTTIIKKHLSFLKIMEMYEEKYSQDLDVRLGHLSDEMAAEYRRYPRLPVLKRLVMVEKKVQLSALQQMKIKEEKLRLFNVRDDLLNILTDTELMQKLVKLSDGAITAGMVETTRLHVARQMHVRETFDYSENTLDGKQVDESTSMDVAETIDEEDYPLLLKLLEMKTGEMGTIDGRIKRFHHIVLDEAQELAPVELMVFSKALTESGNVTIAGDAAQQVDPAISFTGWSDVLHHLNVEQVEVNELSISYRSPQSIIDFTHSILGDQAPDKKPLAKRQGASVRVDQVPHRAQASMQMFEALNDLLGREPRASVAIICNKMKTAELFYEELKDLQNIRLVTEADFSFRPGVDVTTVEQIRGLEFDYVIIPDADKFNYPDNPRARKRLYLAATRAIHQLWLLHFAEICAFVPISI